MQQPQNQAPTTEQQLQQQLAATQAELAVYKLVAKLAEKVERQEENLHSLKAQAEKQLGDLTERNNALQRDVNRLNDLVKLDAEPETRETDIQA